MKRWEIEVSFLFIFRFRSDRDGKFFAKSFSKITVSGFLWYLLLAVFWFNTSPSIASLIFSGEGVFVISSLSTIFRWLARLSALYILTLGRRAYWIWKSERVSFSSFLNYITIIFRSAETILLGIAQPSFARIDHVKLCKRNSLYSLCFVLQFKKEKKKKQEKEINLFAWNCATLSGYWFADFTTRHSDFSFLVFHTLYLFVGAFEIDHFKIHRLRIKTRAADRIGNFLKGNNREFIIKWIQHLETSKIESDLFITIVP